MPCFTPEGIEAAHKSAFYKVQARSRGQGRRKEVPPGRVGIGTALGRGGGAGVGWGARSASTWTLEGDGGGGEMGTLTSHITNIAQNKTRSSPSATARRQPAPWVPETQPLCPTPSENPEALLRNGGEGTDIRMAICGLCPGHPSSCPKRTLVLRSCAASSCMSFTSLAERRATRQPGLRGHNTWI